MPTEFRKTSAMHTEENTPLVTGERTLARPLRVVSIAHSAFLDGSSRKRYYPLAVRSDMDLTLVIPDKWSEEGLVSVKGLEQGPLKVQSHRVLLHQIPKIKWYGHFYPGMARYLQMLAPDVIHLWEEPWSFAALQATFLRDRLFPGAALVLETDQNIYRRLPQPFEWIRRYTLEHTDLLIARQQEALDVAIQCGYKGKSELVEYVIDQALFRPQDQAVSRREFEIPDGGFCIGYVGRIIREKGLFSILDSLKLCTPNVTFLCMGSGRDEKAFREEIIRLELTERVHLFPFSSQAQVAKFIGALDALILMSETTPTWKEQFGRVIIEAQGCGVPVIGSDSGSIPSVIGKGGWIIPEKNAHVLADLLSRLASDPDERHRVASQTIPNTQRFTPAIAAAGLARGFMTASQQRTERNERASLQR